MATGGLTRRLWCGHCPMSQLSGSLSSLHHEPRPQPGMDSNSVTQPCPCCLCRKWPENDKIQLQFPPITISWWGKWPKLPKFDQLTHHRTAVNVWPRDWQWGKWQDKYIFRSGIFYTGGSASKAPPLSLLNCVWVNVFIFISPHQSFLTARGWRYLGLNIATNIWLARFLDKPTFV